ncbi:MFS transporter [Alicyclobacillus cycloheptanicus]|uniref:MFS family arabinose efflux permease n=1 Tax=Alicyclobacillus cycloheptanicus TaxID=1457 RepID=A0ABT9XF02_9BACL|nr:MFS transporter [Alicyclobacillus cycloheptanicus]MDQ0188879.1 putative MFS family arabinose efflux permease [Alicyclobacillus cycloheptanicus]WDM00480.1 MFS transporter [Alicyclobacillus cycloheptanicus]
MKNGRILHQRDFVLMTAGTGLSALGDQMGWMAVLWLVMTHSESSAQMGVAGLCYGLPSVAAGLLAGVLVDRFSALRLMVLDNVGQGLLFVTIPMLYRMHVLPFWLLCVLLMCAGTLSPLTSVGAMTVLPNLVPNELLSKANAWDEALWQGAYLTGPLIGGALIAATGASIAILVDGLSFWACALCLVFVKHAPAGARCGDNQPRSRTNRFVDDIVIGVKGLLSLKVVLAITLVALALNLACGQLDVSLPLLVHREWHRGGATLGILWTAYGVGSLVGTTVMTFIKTDVCRGLWMSAMIAGMGGSLSLITLVRGFWLAVLLMWTAGLCFGPYAPLARTIVQEQVSEGLRGRVFGIRTAAIGAGVPLGSLLAGGMLRRMSPSTWIGVTGAGILCVAVVMLAVHDIRISDASTR